MNVVFHCLLSALVAVLVCKDICNGWWLQRDSQTCSIEECNRGTCVQLRGLAIRQCTGVPCRVSRRHKRVIDRYLYRVLRDDENPNLGLYPKDSSATKSIQSHVGCGSRRNYESQYISSTANFNAAIAWARGANRTVAIIDTHLLHPSTRLIDLTDANDNVLPGVMARNFARKYAEVLIEGYVPPQAIHLVSTNFRQPTCGC